MHFFNWIPLSLVLLLPTAAWSGSVDATTSSPIKAVASRLVSVPQPVRRGNFAPVAADPATLCETAVTTAEYVNRLPPRLLAAISLTETGRPDATTGYVRPWPWTINAEGEGRYFDTRQRAIAAVQALRSRGVQSIDVGCLQVNLMHHPDAFASLEEAFDPGGNAQYAARFLNALYLAEKDWARAVSAYHSETPALGEAYRVLVEARWQHGASHAAVGGQASGGQAFGGQAFGGQGGAYQDFAHDAGRSNQAYGAFSSRSLVYGAFPPR